MREEEMHKKNSVGRAQNIGDLRFGEDREAGSLEVADGMLNGDRNFVVRMKIKLHLARALRRQKAFSLIEVTVGMGILGTVVGAVLSGFTSGIFTMKMARENLRATQIMLERMETIRLYSWDQVTSASYLS